MEADGRLLVGPARVRSGCPETSGSLRLRTCWSFLVSTRIRWWGAHPYTHTTIPRTPDLPRVLYRSVGNPRQPHLRSAPPPTTAARRLAKWQTPTMAPRKPVRAPALHTPVSPPPSQTVRPLKIKIFSHPLPARHAPTTGAEGPPVGMLYTRFSPAACQRDCGFWFGSALFRARPNEFRLASQPIHTSHLSQSTSLLQVRFNFCTFRNPCPRLPCPSQLRAFIFGLAKPATPATRD
jgi:hypothetical protein